MTFRFLTLNKSVIENAEKRVKTSLWNSYFLLFIDEVDSSEEGEVEVKLPDSTNTHPPLRKADSEELLRQEFDKSKLQNNFCYLILFLRRTRKLGA